MTNLVAFEHIGQLSLGEMQTQPVFGDEQALQTWLSIFDLKSKTTARHYRTQVKKFTLYLRMAHPDWPVSSCLKQATEQDIAGFELALSLKAPTTGPRPRYHLTDEQLASEGLDTQPFAKALAKSSINQALSVLNALYEFLREPNGVMLTPYVTLNPVKRVRKSATRGVKQSDRHIPIDGVQAMHTFMLAEIEKAASAGNRFAVQQYERKLWIFSLLFGLWGRRDEISKLVMGDFTQQHDGVWRASLLRKGGKDESVPVANWVMESMRRYRASVGLPRSWPPHDTTPAIGRMRSLKQASAKPVDTVGKLVTSANENQHVSDQLLYLEVKSLANATADALASGELVPGMLDDRREMLIERLRRCSPHWFRHTGPTIAINNGSISVENASKMLGHSNLATTTQMYYHADDKLTRSGLESLGAVLSTGQ